MTDGKHKEVEMPVKDSKASKREKVTVQYDGQSTLEQPIKILGVNDQTGKIELYDEALVEIQKDCVKKEADFVSIISVMGAYRGGKSFLLDLLLRYLRHQAKGTPSQDEEKLSAVWAFDTGCELTQDWLLEGAPLLHSGEKDYIREGKDNSAGFEWCAGDDSHTKGIWLWRTPFIFSEGERKIAVLLMDTQGAWDGDLGDSHSVSFFGFVALVSSKLIYNTQNRLEDRDIKTIDLFTTIAYAACREVGIQDEPALKPFGELHFLVRDKVFTREEKLTDCQHRMDGMLQKLMNGNGSDNATEDRRERLIKCFCKIKCFGLSHPSLNCLKESWDGRVNDLHSDFRYLLDAFAKQLFCEDFTWSKPLGRDLEVRDFATTLREFVHGLEELGQDQDARIGSLRDMFAFQRVVGLKRRFVKDFETWLKDHFPDTKLICPCALDSKIKEKSNTLEKEFKKSTEGLRGDGSEMGEFEKELGEKANARKTLNQVKIEKHKQYVLDELNKKKRAPKETPLIETGELEEFIDKSRKDFLAEFEMCSDETMQIKEVKDLEESIERMHRAHQQLVCIERKTAFDNFEKWLSGGSLSNITTSAKLEQAIEEKTLQILYEFRKRFFYEVSETAPCVKDLYAAMNKRKDEFILERAKQGDASGSRAEGSCADRCCLCNWCQPVKSDAPVATSSV